MSAPTGWLWWATLAPLAFMVTTAGMYLAGAAMFAYALLRPARTAGDSPLRAALQPTATEASRRAAVEASLRWIKAYTRTSRRWRLVQILIGSGIAPAGLASARWQRRAVLLTATGASLRIRQMPDGTWRLDDVAAWPIGSGMAQPLLNRVCAAADTAQATITLTASAPKVAAAVYTPLGFHHTTGAGKMARAPHAPPSSHRLPAATKTRLHP